MPTKSPTSDIAKRSSNRSEEHTSELQSRLHLVCRLLLEKKKKNTTIHTPTFTPSHHDCTSPPSSPLTRELLPEPLLTVTLLAITRQVLATCSVKSRRTPH